MPQRTLADSTTITWDEDVDGVLEAHTSPAAGQMFLQANTTATVLVEDVWTKVAGTTLENDIQLLFDKPVSGRLRYTGTAAIIERVIATFAIEAASNNQTLEFAIFENGVIHEESVLPVALAGSGARDRVAVNLIIEFEPGDYVELWIRNITSSSNATVTSMQFTVG